MFVLSNSFVCILIFLHIQCPVLVKSCQSVYSTIHVSSLKQQDTNLFIHGLFYRISPQWFSLKVTNVFTPLLLVYFPYAARMAVTYMLHIVYYSYVACMSHVCYSYVTRMVLVYFSYFTRMLLVNYSYTIRMLLVCYITCMSLECNLYTSRMLLVCYLYANRMVLICYSYVTRILLVCYS